jgi:hypothetical protein
MHAYIYLASTHLLILAAVQAAASAHDSTAWPSPSRPTSSSTTRAYVCGCVLLMMCCGQACVCAGRHRQGRGRVPVVGSSVQQGRKQPFRGSNRESLLRRTIVHHTVQQNHQLSMRCGIFIVSVWQEGVLVVKSKGEATLISNKPPAESVAAVGRTLLYGSFVKVHVCAMNGCNCVLIQFTLALLLLVLSFLTTSIICVVQSAPLSSTTQHTDFSKTYACA